MSQQSPSALPAWAHLQQDHARLDRIFDDLVGRATYGDWRDCDAVWEQFSRQLEAHMRYEETELFPSYACSSSTAAAVVAQLRSEHASIRRLLDALGIDIQVHAIRADAITELVRTLREHAQREFESFYPWLLTWAPVQQGKLTQCAP